VKEIGRPSGADRESQAARGGDGVARWAEVRAITESALTRSPESRAEFLQRACGGDALLRVEVEAQLRACERAAQSADFLAEPAAVFAAPLITSAIAGEGDSDTRPRMDLSRGTSPTAVQRREEQEAALRAALAGQYGVERELGRGGAATVYLARDRRHARLVALKVLDPGLGAAVSTERFLREIRVTASLTHPHILPLHDSGEAAGLLFYVMPYVDGESLRARLARGEPVALDMALRIMREVASALAYAHRHGLVHRDIKPANILLADGHAVVADFGIARAVHRARESQAADADERAADGVRDATTADVKSHDAPAAVDTAPGTLTGRGVSPGTPAYMAPEQARGGVGVDHRADIYSLGVVAYELLAGVHPFGARSHREMVTAHLDELPPPLAARRPDVPRTVAALVMKCLEKDPARRPQSAVEIVAALEGAVPAAEQLPASTAPRSAGRKVARYVGLAIAVVAVGGVLAFGARIARSGPGLQSAEASDAAGSVAIHSMAVLPFVNAGGSAADDYLSDGITDESAQALALLPEERTAGRMPMDIRRGTADQEAYDLYLEGRYYWMQRGAWNIVRSIAYFRRAIARDSTFARAHAGLALAYSTLPVFLPDSTDSATALGASSAQRALALDSTLADAHLALGLALETRLRPREALAHYRSAVALDPSSVTAHHWLGFSLLNLGHTDEALAQLRRATQLDPMAVSPASATATALLYSRRFREAAAASRRALALDSSFAFAYWTLGLAQAFGGQPDSAVITLEHGMRVRPRDSRLLSALLFAYAAAGRWNDAELARRQLHREGGQLLDGTEEAFAELVFGDRGPLVRVLRGEDGERRYIASGGAIGCNPLFDPLWSDARFRTAMRKLTIEACPLARPWPLQRAR
jgi:serine/threonine-protein kinase